MANLSDLTRKQQVYAYLWDHQNQWVDGPDLATEAVGGSEGLRRLRELRLEGEHDIRERRHPDADRDIWQYMLVLTVTAVPGGVDFSEPPPKGKSVYVSLDLGDDLDFEDSKPVYPDHSTEAARREEEANRLLDLPTEEPESPWPADHGQTQMSSAVRKKEDGTFEYVPPQQALIEAPEPEQPVGDKYTSLPHPIRWGEMAVCPRCKMKTTRGRKTKPRESTAEQDIKREIMQRRKSMNSEDEGVRLIDTDGVLLFRDPHSRKPRPCDRCNGYGIVPNQGPIVMSLPPNTPEPTQHEEAKPMRLDL